MHAPSLLDILLPPANPWLCRLVPGKTHLPAGVRLLRHASHDDDSFERSVNLRSARSKLRGFVEGTE